MINILKVSNRSYRKYRFLIDLLTNNSETQKTVNFSLDLLQSTKSAINYFRFANLGNNTGKNRSNLLPNCLSCKKIKNFNENRPYRSNLRSVHPSLSLVAGFIILYNCTILGDVCTMVAAQIFLGGGRMAHVHANLSLAAEICSAVHLYGLATNIYGCTTTIQSYG